LFDLFFFALFFLFFFFFFGHLDAASCKKRGRALQSGFHVAQSLLFLLVGEICPEEDGVHYTIEARQLTNQATRSREDGPRHLTVEARDAGEAISKFVEEDDSELVSFTGGAGRESIATVKKEDSVFLVRVYPD
jgi:hypothetical protein